MKRLMILLCGLLLWISSASAGQPGGYFLVFELHQGHLQAPTIMQIDEYVASPALPEAADAWQLQVLDGHGVALFSTALSDPYRLQRAARGDVGEPLLMARVPQLEGAERMQLSDADGKVRWQQAMDQGFRAAAAATREQTAGEVRSHISVPSAQSDAAEIGRSAAQPQSSDAEQQQRQDEMRTALKARGENADDAERTAAEAWLRQQLDREREQRQQKRKAKKAHADQGGFLRPAAAAGTPAPGLRTVSGSVRTLEGIALSDVSVRVRLSDGSYVTSTVTDEDGGYELYVRPGQYTLQIDSGAREGLFDDNFLFVQSTPVAVTVASASDLSKDLKLDAPVRTLTVFVRWDSWLQSPAEMRVERAGVTVARPRLGIWDNANSDGTATWTLRMTPGLYDLTLQLPTGGLATVSKLNVDLRSANQTVEFDARSPAWKGRVLDSAGAPLVGTEVIAYDGLGRYRSWDLTDANGYAEVAMAAGWTLEFLSPETGALVRKRITVGNPATVANTVKLDTLPLTSTRNGSVERIFTGSNSQRIKMVYIGDGYTSARETFTDRNGNGVWDGVLWYDINRNGKYDKDTDIVAVYGDAIVPVDGDVNLGANNEPFADLNGDGFLSMNDEAVLRGNARSHMRALLGGDYFEQRRDRFQADVAFVVSRQAGMTVTDDNGNVIRSADTYFGANMSTERNVVNLDRRRAALLAEQLVPGFDEVIVMVNQPIPAGRATQTIGGGPGVMVTNGGELANNPNSATPAHEMGHFIGDLWDEYSEHFTNDDGTEVYDGANVTNSLVYALIPWASWLSPERPRPDLVPREGLGMFEGANYVQGGAYRPDWNSMMRYGILFNAPSVRKMDQRFGIVGPVAPANPLSGNWYDRSHSGHGFDLQLLKRDAANGDEYYLVFYTYDASGAGDWFTALGNYRNGRFIARADANGNTLSHIRYDASKPPGQRIVLDGSIRGSIDMDFGNPSQCRAGREAAVQLAAVNWKIGNDSATWCIEPTVNPARLSQPNLSGHWYSAGDGGWGFEAMSLTAANGATELILYLYYPDAAGKPRWATASTTNYRAGDSLVLSEVASGYCRTCVPKPLSLRPIGNISLTLSNSGASQATIRVDGAGNFQRTGAPLSRLSLPPGQ
ncbi:MAG: M64 family metallopeptidase [Dokdonella sp.]